MGGRPIRGISAAGTRQRRGGEPAPPAEPRPGGIQTGWSRHPYGEDLIPGRTYLVRIYSRKGLAGNEIVEGVQLYLGRANWEGGLGLDQVLAFRELPR